MTLSLRSWILGDMGTRGDIEVCDWVLGDCIILRRGVAGKGDLSPMLSCSPPKLEFVGWRALIGLRVTPASPSPSPAPALTFPNDILALAVLGLACLRISSGDAPDPLPILPDAGLCGGGPDHPPLELGSVAISCGLLDVPPLQLLRGVFALDALDNWLDLAPAPPSPTPPAESINQLVFGESTEASAHSSKKPPCIVVQGFRVMSRFGFRTFGFCLRHDRASSRLVSS